MCVIVVILTTVTFVDFWLGTLVFDRPYYSAEALVTLALVVNGISRVLRHLYPPAWVSVGPNGVAFRNWFRAAHFRWDEVESFQVGNPYNAQFAYLISRHASEKSRAAIKLPEFHTISGFEVVETLRQKRGVYCAR